MTELLDALTLTVSPLTVPATLDAEDAEPFLEMVRIGNDLCLADAGHDFLREEPLAVLGFWQDQADWTQVGFTAERDGRIIGAARIMLANETDAVSLDFDVMVDPPRRGEGAEEALLAAVEREARSRGRPTIQSWTLHRPDTVGARLTPSRRC